MNNKHKLQLGKKKSEKKKYKNMGCNMWDLIIWMTLLVKSDYIKN